MSPRRGSSAARRLLFLVNPRARSYSRSTVEVIRRALATDFEVELRHTAGRGHGAEVGHEAIDAGFEIVVVFSGDGTINEVVNGLSGSEVALGIIPGGATNVYARILGIPNDPIEATGQLIELAIAGRARRIPVGSANDRIFVMNCGIGLDAAVMRKVERRAPRSKVGHEREAFFAAMTEANRYIGRQSRDLTLRIDEHLQLTAVSVMIAKAHPYAFFKSWGLKVHPRAELMKGLDVLAIQELPRIAGPKITYELFVGGNLERSRYVQYEHDVERIEIASPRAFPVQLDGEYVGEFEALDVQLVRDALWVVA
ncbi:MAG: diacylglycerol kinase family protein [Actinomycetota bacterium]